MLFDKNDFSKLKNEIYTYLKKYEDLKTKSINQKDEILRLGQEVKFLQNKNNNLKTDLETERIKNTMLGKEENKKIMNKKIDFLVNEIEKCIKQLKKDS